MPAPRQRRATTSSYVLSTAERSNLRLRARRHRRRAVLRHARAASQPIAEARSGGLAAARATGGALALLVGPISEPVRQTRHSRDSHSRVQQRRPWIMGCGDPLIPSTAFRIALSVLVGGATAAVSVLSELASARHRDFLSAQSHAVITVGGIARSSAAYHRWLPANRTSQAVVATSSNDCITNGCSNTGLARLTKLRVDPVSNSYNSPSSDACLCDKNWTIHE